MQQKVAKFVKRHQQLQRNSTCLVGVSGGPDSMALLHFLHEISAEYNLRIIAVAIDHLLRGAESARDIEYVREVCEMWGIEFVSVRVDVAAYKREHKVGTQVAARTLRYEVYKEQAAHYKADYIALGHHGDDQIETIIMGVTRATNLQTVSGIPAKRPFFGAEIIRPFLCVTKREILDYCAQHDIHPRIDPSNLETAYTRNDIRANVVPLLKGRNHNLHRTMQSLSESLQEDEAFILKMASDYVEKHVILRDNPRTVTFSLKSFYQCPFLYKGVSID